MDNFAEPQLSCDSNIPPSAEPVSSSHNMHAPSEDLNCDMDDGDVQNQIQPTDSVSNVGRKTTTTYGSRTSRSSIASAHLKVKAEMAALLAHQKMLSRKHVLEKEEEKRTNGTGH